MSFKQKSEKIFSCNPFEIIKEYQERSKEPNVSGNRNDIIIRKKVQIPFSVFCNLLYREIPQEVSFNNFPKLINLEYQHTLINQIYLHTYLDIFSMLYIEMKYSGITIGFESEIGEIIAKKIANINPEIIAKLIARDIHLFRDLCIDHDNILYWDENDILNSSVEELIYKFNRWFEPYLPLLCLAVSNKVVPSLSRYLNDNNPIYCLNNLAQDTNLLETDIERWIQIIYRKNQVILFGSPGTGKTYIAEKIAKHLIGGSDGFSELVQFHPAYSYEDFIQGIRPQSQDGKLTYPLVPGRFLEFCKKAESRQDTCVLIIDEINRANLAQVFGELMYLLEYRDREIPLAAGNTFRIPKNVRIIGTMNTADRSIAQIDHALRRRFAFIELRTNYDVLRRYHLKTGFAVEDLIKILQELNQAIADKNYEIGISFFLTDNLRDNIQDIWQMEIEPYLEEYFFNQLDKVDEFRWNKISEHLDI